MLLLTATSQETPGVSDSSSRKHLTTLANAFYVSQVLQHSRHASDFEQARKLKSSLSAVASLMSVNKEMNRCWDGAAFDQTQGPIRAAGVTANETADGGAL